jgi:hypothetical protein
MMNKYIQNSVSTLLFILMMLFSGIGMMETVKHFTAQPTIDLMTIYGNNSLPQTNETIPEPSTAASESISGDVSANLGELCVFRLTDPTTRADWMIVPETKFYIDSSGSSLAFASNVPARYTIIAAVVIDGRSKILTHVIDYGISPEPTPSPAPEPSPEPKPVTLSQWVHKNVPPLGYSQASALAACYESVVTGIESGRIKTPTAAYSVIRTSSQTKINLDLWQPFLDQLSIKITENLKGSTDIHELGIIFSQIAEGLNQSVRSTPRSD